MRGMMKDRSCAQTPYCTRNRDTNFLYIVDKDSIMVEENAVTVTLNFLNETMNGDVTYARKLYLVMEFFQQGIVHFKIHEENDQRFYISGTGIGVDHALEGEDLSDKVI
jgi:hypothetical protein